jgi:hypothetical protein
MPFETAKVTLAIHWEALRLRLKGARFRGGPPSDGKPIARHSASAAPAAPPSSRWIERRGHKLSRGGISS